MSMAFVMSEAEFREWWDEQGYPYQYDSEPYWQQLAAWNAASDKYRRGYDAARQERSRISRQRRADYFALRDKGLTIERAAKRLGLSISTGTRFERMGRDDLDSTEEEGQLRPGSQEARTG